MAGRKRDNILEEFIEIYKSVPCLWRVKCKEYHDRDKRTTAYEKLETKLKELEPTATKDYVIKKINTLRSNVRREKKKYEESVKSGASSDDIYKRTLWYFHLFDFIIDQDVPRSSRSNISCDEDDSNDAENSTEITIDNDTTDNAAVSTDDITAPKKTPLPATKPGRNKMTEQDQLTTDILLSVKDHFKRPASATEDRYDLLGRSIAMKLRSLDKRQRLIAEKIINDTLFDAEMGNLNTEAIQNRRSLTLVSSPTPSLSRTPSPSASLVQQYYTQPCVSPIQQYNTPQQRYTISPAPQSEPCASLIQQFNTQQQTTSPAPQRQPSPALQEEFDTQLTTATFYSNFNS